jgi:hypothetical protein
MTLTIAHVTPLVAPPRRHLDPDRAAAAELHQIYLIIVGLIGLNTIHHFIR